MAQSEWDKEQEAFGKLVKAAAKVLVQHLPQDIIVHTAERLIRTTLENLKNGSFELSAFVREVVHSAIKDRIQELLATKYKNQMDEIASKAAEKAILDLANRR
jgi:hypothetical protein